ncbi:MAG: hypothetical protein QXO03_00900 [Thermoplasmatales archaeon]
MASEKKNEEKEWENVSIKGVQKSLYDRMKRLARETGRTIGEVTNDAYKITLSAASETKKVGEEFFQGLSERRVIFIHDLRKLEITGEELKGYNKKVAFRNIENLSFKDLSRDDFDRYVDSITNVKSLSIPKEIPKFDVLEKSTFVDEIKFL